MEVAQPELQLKLHPPYGLSYLVLRLQLKVCLHLFLTPLKLKHKQILPSFLN